MIISMCGCITQQGRLHILDFDFRKPNQILAYSREAEAPYKDWDKTQTEENEEYDVEAKAIPITWWTKILELVTKLECRFTLLRIEWKDVDNTK